MYVPEPVTAAHGQKGEPMDVREKLIQILSVPIYHHLDADPAEVVADYLLDNGVTITPATPGPTENNPNIMELCFHNGEQHMKEKIIDQLQSVAGSLPCITLAQVIKIVEDL